MRIDRFVFAVVFLTSFALAQQPPSKVAPEGSPSTGQEAVALTIYNQSFAVARTSLDLDLHPGLNEITTSSVTSMLEPDSVVLRDSATKLPIQVLEQNYDAAVVNQEWLLQKYEGKTIDFQVATPQGTQTLPGKIIRAGFTRQGTYAPNGQYLTPQQAQPLVEINGRMQFSLPGLPLFPSATDGLLLKPTLRWQINSGSAAHVTAELAYITGGLDWDATYNVIAPQNADVTSAEKVDLLGWVTIHNQAGTDFPRARIKLMAGDVAKLRQAGYGGPMMKSMDAVMVAGAISSPEVTQKAFDDFHLYDLNRTVALRDGETKQVQFIDAAAVSMRRSYLYDGLGMQLQPIYGGNVFNNQGYGVGNENKKVQIIEEIKNSESNHLGMPLPAGRVRLYRRDSDGQVEFVGENQIGHTPAEETIKVPTGSAFDLKGSRRQTEFHVDYNRREMDETFEIKVTNQKQQEANVSVIEHMYRCDNWNLTAKSVDFKKLDSHTLEFPLQVPAKGEAVLTYTVHYTW
ncbi:MAG TPA: hypothetical protein VGI45_23870 [Terracidiphilus sp.]